MFDVVRQELVRWRTARAETSILHRIIVTFPAGAVAGG